MDEVKLAQLLATNYVSDRLSSYWTKSVTISSMMYYTEWLYVRWGSSPCDEDGVNH